MATTITSTNSDNDIMDYLVHTYIEVKGNPSVGLPQVMVDWTERTCQPTAKEPYGEALTFTEAFEKYVIPKMTEEARRKLEMVLLPTDIKDDRYDTTSYAAGTIMRADPTVEMWGKTTSVRSSENALLEENAELHKEVAKLKAVIEYLESQNAFDNVIKTRHEADMYDEELPF